jgi:luciferase family oxidoreductase group 1
VTLTRAIPLSVLDLASVSSGSTPTRALRNTVDLARRTERLGFTRFWLAEHHGMPGIASSAPAVLIAHVADATSTLRVGSGGVMLPNHPPLIVAEQFGMLEAMHPGRIDLGIGRAPGTDQATARALRRTAGPLSADDFPEQLGELVAFFTGGFPPGHPYADILAVPARGNMPPVWLLGSSGYSAQVAGILGLPFAFAHHFSSENTLPALELYRSSFRPSAGRDRPYAMVAAAVICAETDQRARELAAPSGLAMLRLRQGRPGVWPSPEEAAAYPYTALDRQIISSATGSHIVGGPETVRKGLDELLAATAADELMIITNVHGHDDRIRSYELIAELAELPHLAEPEEPAAR